MKSFDYSCRHRTTEWPTCVAFATFTASVFVLNLYLLVPKTIRSLSRDDPIQIKWRIFSVIATIIFNMIIYPFIFCENSDYDNALDTNTTLANTMGLTGWTWHRTFLPLFHTILLYMGPILTSLLKKSYFKDTKKQSRNQPSKTGSLNLTSFLSQVTWEKSRDYFIAPLAEEVSFRSCIVTPFLHMKTYQDGELSLSTICWCTPLFFGIAHLHHAIRRLREKQCNVKIVILSSAFQFLYTTVFGAYATFCLVKTCSIIGVIMLHSFCNLIGLPSLSFMFVDDKGFKMLCSFAYIGGIVCFWFGFYSSYWNES